MKNLIHVLLILLSIALIIIGIIINVSSFDDFLNMFLTSIGTSLFVALTVAKIFENFSLKKLDEKFSYWNRKAAQASISGIIGEEIPEEITDNLYKIINYTGIKRSDYDETYRFFNDNGKPSCNLSVSFSIKNYGDKVKYYPFRHELFKGFFPDYGKDFSFDYFKVYDLDTNKIIIEKDKRERKQTENTYYYEKKFRLTPEQSLRITSVVKFRINEHFFFYDSFYHPIQKLKITLEHNFTNAKLGFSSSKFWKDKFIKEHSNKNFLQLNYNGVVFPGQGIGLWMHIYKL